MRANSCCQAPAFYGKPSRRVAIKAVAHGFEMRCLFHMLNLVVQITLAYTLILIANTDIAIGKVHTMLCQKTIIVLVKH